MTTTVDGRLYSVLLGIDPRGAQPRIDLRRSTLKGFTTSPPPEYFFHGAGSLSGNTKDGGNNPLSRRVLVIDRLTGEVVRRTVSWAPDGSFSVDGINENRKYLVVGLDDAPPVYNAARIDNVSPVI